VDAGQDPIPTCDLKPERGTASKDRQCGEDVSHV